MLAQEMGLNWPAINPGWMLAAGSSPGGWEHPDGPGGVCGDAVCDSLSREHLGMSLLTALPTCIDQEAVAHCIQGLIKCWERTQESRVRVWDAHRGRFGSRACARRIV